LAALSELPPESEADSGKPQFEAVVADMDEDSNVFIKAMKAACTKDQLDYCTGAKWKSVNHTMCQYCVSCLNRIAYVISHGVSVF
jgi:hypothetical protein